jgi:hypothetical protein
MNERNNEGAKTMNEECKAQDDYGTDRNPVRYEHVSRTDPDRAQKLEAQREQFTQDAKAGRVICLSDLMISHGM